MTSKERAETLVRHWAPDSCASMAVDIKRAIDLAVAEEREECAKIAEDDDFIIAGRAYATAEDIAKRIRARSTVKPEPQIPMRNLPRASAKLDKDGK